MLPFLALGFCAALYTAYYEHHLVRAEGSHWILRFLSTHGHRGTSVLVLLGKLVLSFTAQFHLPAVAHPPRIPYGLDLADRPRLDFSFYGYGRRWWGKMPLRVCCSLA